MFNNLNLNPGAGFNQSAGMFNFSFAPGVSLEQITNFKAAGLFWSAYLDDDITINIHVETSDYLPEYVIGAALPRIESGIGYDKVLKALNADISSATDQLAFNNLPGTYEWQKGDEKTGRRGQGGVKRGSSKFDVLVEGGLVEGVNKLNLTSANAKALGLSNLKPQDLDGYILIGNLNNLDGINWDYDFFDGKTTGLDFFSVAIHEIGHVMGFVSGVDDSEWLAQVADFKGVDYSTVVYDKFEETGMFLKAKDIDKPEMATVLDLFRFTDLSASQKVIDLSVSDNAYFSIDGGTTKLSSFSSGDEHQASHWQVDSSTGIMDSTIKLNEQKVISNIDLISMDVIGYDVKSKTDGNIVNQVASELARNFGISLNQLSEMLGNNVTESALTFSNASYRVPDILTMMKESKVYDEVLDALDAAYNWGFGGGNGYHWGFGGGNGYHWGFGGGNGYHASIAPYLPIFAQKYFNTFDPEMLQAFRQDSQTQTDLISQTNLMAQTDSISSINLDDLIAWEDNAPTGQRPSNNAPAINWSELEVDTNSGLATQIIFTDTIQTPNELPQEQENLVQELIGAL